MPKKIYWVSQHPPLARQLARLRKLFGADVQIEKDGRPFSSADEIIARYRATKADDLVVVAPLSVLDYLCRGGVQPLWADMVQVPTAGEGDVSVKGRHYKFIRFRRVKEVKIEFEPDFDDGTD